MQRWSVNAREEGEGTALWLSKYGPGYASPVRLAPVCPRAACLLDCHCGVSVGEFEVGVNGVTRVGCVCMCEFFLSCHHLIRRPALPSPPFPTRPPALRHDGGGAGGLGSAHRRCSVAPASQNANLCHAGAKKGVGQVKDIVTGTQTQRHARPGQWAMVCM